MGEERISMSDIPSIVGGPRLQVKKKVEFDLPCPKCSKDMRVTEVGEGSVIACKNCSNVTWRMAYEPPWWAKTSKFILSLVATFVLGVVTSLFASWLYEKYQQARPARPQANVPTAIQKK